jgi:hypothetical protein
MIYRRYYTTVKRHTVSDETKETEEEITNG